jgi:hypothetical protein
VFYEPISSKVNAVLDVVGFFAHDEF